MPMRGARVEIRPRYRHNTFRALMRMRMNDGDKMMIDRIENGAIKAMYISPTLLLHKII